MKELLPYDKTDPRSIEKYAQRMIDHCLSDFLDIKKRKLYKLTSNVRKKGGLGQLIEQEYFYINPGTYKGPDFKEAGVELKTSPLKEVRDGWWSKERLVLGIINYNDIINETWEKSSFKLKNDLLLLIFYLYKDGIPIIDLLIRYARLWRIPEDDIPIIKNDWETIKNKIEKGLAHEISEGDTLYLGACTKGATKESVRTQPASKIKAKQRAFAFKQKYVNFILKTFLRDSGFLVKDSDKIVKNSKEFETGKSFEQIVIDRFKPYLGRSIRDIGRELGVNIDKAAKNYNDILTKGILGVINTKIEEFEKADIIVKSIVLEKSGNLKESISFPAFDYVELSKEKSWDDSKLKYLFGKKFFFVVYQKDGEKSKVLKKVMFWNMPYDDLNKEARSVWKETVRKIRAGECDDLPKISNNRVSHVRPHGINKLDVCKAPDGKFYTKKCFWLNAKYVRDQIGKIY